MNCKDLQKIENRNISIITNFGCRANCWYCIWKGHKLENVNPNTDWNKLEQFLEQYKSKGKVSLSGGGDCLYKFEEHKEWWDKFLTLIEEKHLKLDIHTREKVDYLDNNWSIFFNKINKVVFSSDHLDIINQNISCGRGRYCIPDRDYLVWLRDLINVRITHLVTKNTSFGMIEDYIDYTKKYGMQFTIKHLVGYDDGNMYNLILERYPDLFHLDDGDYNIYYMPDNTVQTKFLF